MTKSKTPLGLRTIQWVFPKFESIAPQTAGKWAIKKFFTPMKHAYEK